jgi:hypothetical protein
MKKSTKIAVIILTTKKTGQAMYMYVTFLTLKGIKVKKEFQK